MSLFPQSSAAHGQQGQSADRTMDQIEALQIQIGELERESNKQSCAVAGLEQRCQQEEDEVEALAKTLDFNEAEAARKKEKLQELQQQKEHARQQMGEIMGSKTELETIYDEARKHRDTAGESMRKLRSEYAERLQESNQLQEMVKTMKRRIAGGIEDNLANEQSPEKNQKLRDAHADLQMQLAQEAANAEDNSLCQEAKIDEQRKQNIALEQMIEAHRAEITEYEELIRVQESEAARFDLTLAEHAEFRDGIHRDHKDMTTWLQKATALQGLV